MTKRLMAGLVAVLMAVVPMAANAEVFEATAAGFSVEVPEGMEPTGEYLEESIGLYMTAFSDAPDESATLTYVVMAMSSELLETMGAAMGGEGSGLELLASLMTTGVDAAAEELEDDVEISTEIITDEATGEEVLLISSSDNASYGRTSVVGDMTLCCMVASVNEGELTAEQVEAFEAFVASITPIA